MLPWFLCAGLGLLVAVLIIKIKVMQKSMNEICDALTEHLSSDTNQLITVSSADRYVRKLAAHIAEELAVLRRQRRQYVNGDRELKEAVTNISHDLRTPLTAICGYLDLMEREDKTANMQRYLAQITDRTEALKLLTEELFRYSVISSVSELRYEELDIRRVLEDSLLSFVGALEQKGISPQIILPPEKVSRTLDRSALSRIFGNIIGNAVKYSDGDFSVALHEDGRIEFLNTAAELSAVEVGKLFDRFYTVDLARKSTGLGLSIAKLLTERMNGTIGAEYREGTLSITVHFPDGPRHNLSGP